MRAVFTFMRREMQKWFLSPVGYIVMACYYAATGWELVDGIRAAEGNYIQLASLVAVIAVRWLPLVVAAATMRCFSKARGDASLDTLLSIPVSDKQIIAGKFGGAGLIVLLAALGNVIPVAVILAISPEHPMLDVGSLAGALLGVALLVGLWCAVGVLISLLTSHQGVACIVTLTVCSGSVHLPATMGGLHGFHPIETGLSDMAEGLLSLNMLVFYLGCTATLLFLSVRTLERLRWR